MRLVSYSAEGVLKPGAAFDTQVFDVEIDRLGLLRNTIR